MVTQTSGGLQLNVFAHDGLFDVEATNLNRLVGPCV
jgi:hypothetical protein